MELRFDKRCRTFQTLQFIIMVLLLLPVTLFIPALVFSEGKKNTLSAPSFCLPMKFHFLYSKVTDCSVHLINGILCGVCVFYTMIGGVRAVIWTDVVQALVMITSSFAVVTIGTLNLCFCPKFNSILLICIYQYFRYKKCGELLVCCPPGDRGRSL